MNGVLLWKEYRQQRALWLAIALLAIFLAVILNQTLDKQNAGSSDPRDHLPSTVNLVLFCLMVAHGTVTGSVLLAGEKEDGTLVFLDRLTGVRGPLWARKAVVGALFTLAQCLVLAGLLMGFSPGSWSQALIMPLLGLDGLAWGLLGGALFRTVLPATLFGILAMAGSWCLFSLPGNAAALLVGVAGTALLAGYFSWRKFCGDDALRIPAGTQYKRRFTLPASWRVVGWLAYRQGRLVLLISATSALLLGLFVNYAPLILWPCVTMLLGLTCGLAVFAPDQLEGNLFLGAQRFPPGRIWAVKTIFWGFVLLGLTGLLWYTATALACYVAMISPFRLGIENVGDALRRVGNVGFWLTKWLKQPYNPDNPYPLLNPVLLLGLWPVYGFSFGQFIGLSARRPVIALFLSFCITPIVAVFWVPSILIGGVATWQAFVIPLLLLLTTRFALWPWMAGRLLTLRPLLGITASSLFVVIYLAGFLVYRAVEVPDVGEPFDVKEYIASLPTAEHQAEAERPLLVAASAALLATPQTQGPLLFFPGLLAETHDAAFFLRRATDSLKEQHAKVEARLGPPTEPVEGDQAFERQFGTGEKNIPHAYGELFEYALQHGWPKKDKDLGRWLDAIFEGDWVADVQTAARLPLGMLHDPRRYDERQSSSSTGVDQGVRQMTSLFVLRALQRQARGDSRGALDDLETDLLLCRQVKNYAPTRVFLIGESMESATLSGFRLWLQKTGPDRDSLRAALALLRRLEEAEPDVANVVKAQYLVDRERGIGVPLDEEPNGLPIYKAFLLPWEKERSRRTVNAYYAGDLRLLREPVEQSAPSNLDYVSRLAVEAGLPPKNGPGSSLSARKWGEFILEARVFELSYLGRVRYSTRRSHQLRHATELLIAVAAFQADHGKPPAKLDDLVPTYFAELPIDPLSGRPFRYRISEGAAGGPNGPGQAGSDATELVPGQAVIESTDRDRRIFFPVPTWKE